jgi:undecaprenyl-diphosphatase
VTLLQIVVLAMVQGITEFLPISSSGHLALVPALTGWPDQGLAMDVAVHVGTMFAVVLYFWRDVASAALGCVHLVDGRSSSSSRLALYLIVGTIPLAIVGGAVVALGLDKYLRSIEVIGWASIIFGLLLYFADRAGMTLRRLEHMTVGAAVAIGMAQTLALIPGASRAGVTMTAARLMGFERQAAARFSMLLSIPAILAAGVLKSRELYESGQFAFGSDVAIAAALAFAIALASIAVLMFWLRRAGFTPFVVYRIMLGAGLLWWVYST